MRQGMGYGPGHSEKTASGAGFPRFRAGCL